MMQYIINARIMNFTYSQACGNNCIKCIYNSILSSDGMSWAQLIQLKWHDDFQITSSHQLFELLNGEQIEKNVVLNYLLVL